MRSQAQTLLNNRAGKPSADRELEESMIPNQSLSTFFG